MIQLVLVVLGVVYLCRRPGYVKAEGGAFPNVPMEKFEEWRALELRSIDVFLWATWGTFAASLVLGAVLGAGGGGSQGAGMAIAGVLVVVFLVGLVISAIAGSRAAAIRKEYGIRLR